MANTAGSQMLVMSPNRHDSERYLCSSCSKSFARKAHMLRHQQQHASQKPFNCTFCSKAFKRSDVLRAHQFRCKERGNVPVPDGQSKGRKRSSCQSCVKLRTRCDQDTPCARCLELGKPCIRAPSHSKPNGGTPLRSKIPQLRGRDGITIHHLLNSSPGDNFIGRFPARAVTLPDTGEEESISFADAEDLSETSQWSEEPETYDPDAGAADANIFAKVFGGVTFTSSVMRGGNALPASQPSMPIMTSSSAQDLEDRATKVRQVLQLTASDYGTRLPECRYMLNLEPAIAQLSGEECGSLINLYFDNYHRHCPIIHRPSFRSTLCPIPLFLAILILGGMYAPEPDRVQRMRSLLDVIEAHVFSLPGLRDEYQESIDLSHAKSEDALQSQFETFQGAYLITVANYFSGNVAAKRRARRQRYNRVLDIARSFKLPTAQHPPSLSVPGPSNFTAWIRTETYIRHMNAMLAFDAAMAIFNNVPPRVPFWELDLQLPCDSIHFELASYSEMLSTLALPQPKMKLLDAFQKLFVAPTDLPSVYDEGALNCLDMLYLIHCLYTHVWRQTYANPLLRSSPSTLHAPSTIVEPLKLAIKNWKTIWDGIRTSLNRDQLHQIGFATSADSYWALTKLVVERFEGKDSQSRSHSVSSSTTSNPITPGSGMGVSMNIMGYPTIIHQEPIRYGQQAVPGAYINVGIGNAMPFSSHPVGAVKAQINHYPNHAMNMSPGMAMAMSPNMSYPASGAMEADYNNFPPGIMPEQACSIMPLPPQDGGALDLMPIETDFDSQGTHLRKILQRDQ